MIMQKLWRRGGSGYMTQLRDWRGGSMVNSSRRPRLDSLTHIMAHSHFYSSSRGSDTLFWSPKALHAQYMQAKYSYVENSNKYIFF